MWQHNNPRHVAASTRRRILTRDQHTCQACGATEVALEVDHINNTRGPDYNHDTNLQTLCMVCHQAKTQHEAAAARAHKQTKLRRRPQPHPGLV